MFSTRENAIQVVHVGPVWGLLDTSFPYARASHNAAHGYTWQYMAIVPAMPQAGFRGAQAIRPRRPEIPYHRTETRVNVSTACQIVTPGMSCACKA